VDSIWYANFYLICAIIPVYALLTSKKKKTYTHLPLLLLPIALVSRAFFDSPISFYSCWILIFVTLLFIVVPQRGRDSRKYLGFYGLLFAVWVYNIWPLQMTIPSGQISTTLSLPPIPPQFSHLFDDILVVLNAPITLDLIVKFTFFLLFHLSFGVVLLLIMSFRQHEMRYDSFTFLFMLLIGCVGTLYVFAGLSTGKDTLIPVYIYSDSRFFLSLSLLGLIASSRYFGLHTSASTVSPSRMTLRRLVTDRRMRRQYVAFIVVAIGLIPSFAAIPTGLTLINATQRYAWVGIGPGTQLLGDTGTIFLADRAREFSWITGRRSAELRLSGKGIPNSQALLNLHQSAARFGADYVLVDLYTIARWRTLDVLFVQSYELGDSIPLDSELLLQTQGNSTDFVPSATLVFQTQPNNEGDYSRIFRFENASYEKEATVDLWDSGWAAGNGGNLVNFSGTVGVQIGLNQNYTFIWHPAEPYLDLALSPGFALFEIEELNATVSRIEFWDVSGEFSFYAERLSDGVFFSPIGNASIGDIRIVIEGESYGTVLLNEISFWQQVEN
ncbi:MAG: hypothetical protein ACXABY_10925, partial [Candidatus Thorarchaeota archaeon]